MQKAEARYSFAVGLALCAILVHAGSGDGKGHTPAPDEPAASRASPELLVATEPSPRSEAFPATEWEGTPAPHIKEAFEAAYEEYVICFTQQNISCLQRFLAEDVEFVSQGLPGFHDRSELLKFFSELWQSLSENLVVHGYRYEKGWMFVDLANTLTVHKNIPDVAGQSFAAGQYHLRGEVGYKIVNGKINKIYDGVSPFVD